MVNKNCEHQETELQIKQQNTEKRIPVLYKNDENCCGCSACYAVCPVEAIAMEKDNEGFIYPVVLENKCIYCYKCLSVCMFKNDQKKKGFYD